VNDKENNTHHRISDAITGPTIEANGDTIVYSIKGQLAYFNASAHINRFEKKIKGYDNVVLRLRELHFVDIDGVDALDEIITIIEKQGKQVYISGLDSRLVPIFSHSKHFRDLKEKKHFFEKTTGALKEIGYAFNV